MESCWQKVGCKSAGEPAGSDPLIVLSKSFVCKAYGIIGFPKFLDGHYIYLIVAKEKVGKLLGSMVYRVVEARLEMILNQEASCLYKVGKQRVRETKYLGIFNSLDMSDFYFSYDLDLTQNLETILMQMSGITGVTLTQLDQSRHRRHGTVPPRKASAVRQSSRP